MSVKISTLWFYAIGWLFGEWMWPSEPKFGHWESIISIAFFIIAVWLIETIWPFPSTKKS